MSLTQSVLNYQNKQLSFEDLRNEILLFIYHSPSYYKMLGENFSEFVLYSMNRIKSMCDKFKHQGKPFEAYLYSGLKFNLYNFQEEKRKENIREETYCMSEDSGNGIHSDHLPGSRTETIPTITYNESTCGKEITAYLKKARTEEKRKILVLIRESNSLTESQFLFYANKINMPSEYLIFARNEVTRLTSHRHETLIALKEKRDYLHLELRVLYEDKNRFPTLSQKSENRISSLKRRINNLGKKIKKLCIRPTNQQLAQILGLPKGTIDSSMHYLRKQWGSDL